MWCPRGANSRRSTRCRRCRGRSSLACPSNVQLANCTFTCNTHRQVIIVLTQLEGSGGFSIAHRLTHRLANSRGLHDWGPPGATHCPPIENVHGLHAPRLIT